VTSKHRFEARRVTVAPGRALAHDEAEWRGALVVVAHGRIELEATGGTRRTFERGAVLWLVGVPLRAVHNHGPEHAVMVAFTRRR
jgi:quercetin dioxygenase-like cupin family protein